MIGDLLLSWMSEIGAGSITDFRARATWLARTEKLDIHESSVNRWLRSVSSLGHLEVDWKNNKWAVAPPVITRLPLADGLAIHVGARRTSLSREIDESGIYTEVARRPISKRAIPVPKTILLPYERVDELVDAATKIGAQYTGCSAEMISRMLPQNCFEYATAPPAYDSRVETLVDCQFPKWKAVSTRSSSLSEGLYRELINGRWHYILRRSNSWLATDLAHGMFSEFDRLGRSALRWRSDPSSHDQPGIFIVDKGVPLPPLHSRALVLCSGFIPRVNETANTVIFDNVPHKIGSRVASALNQTLAVSS